MSDINPAIRRVRSLAESEITTLLSDLASPVRLASQSPNGFPLISTLWAIYEDGIFWCITQHRTLLRDQGLASLDLADGGRMTECIINRYLTDPNGPIATGMRKQVLTEYAIAIRPRWVRGQGTR
jgi:hypothetical protein